VKSRTVSINYGSMTPGLGVESSFGVKSMILFQV